MQHLYSLNKSKPQADLGNANCTGCYSTPTFALKESTIDAHGGHLTLPSFVSVFFFLSLEQN